MWGSSPPVCWKHVHTGRQDIRMKNGIFKNSNAMYFQWKKNQEKPENRKKTNTSTKVTIDKNKKQLLRGAL